MLDTIPVEYYHKARVEELEREADHIYRARRAQADEKPGRSSELPCVQQPQFPYSGLRPKSVCR